jgi:hypothetical protein
LLAQPPPQAKSHIVNLAAAAAAVATAAAAVAIATAEQCIEGGNRI